LGLDGTNAIYHAKHTEECGIRDCLHSADQKHTVVRRSLNPFAWHPQKVLEIHPVAHHAASTDRMSRRYKPETMLTGPVCGSDAVR
jgi:hypothetical protein